MQRGVEKNGWRILGPGGGGAQYIPTIKPDDPDTVLVACDMTGAYITRDGGQRWRQINLKAWIKSFAFSARHPNTVYAGGTGLYRSLDAGETWRLVFPNPETVTDEVHLGDHADHSYRSTDNWPGGKIEAIQLDPQNPDHILVGINQDGLRLFSSANFGASWREQGILQGEHILRSHWEEGGEHRLLFLTEAGLFACSPEGLDVNPLPLPDVSRITDFCAGKDAHTSQDVFFLTSPGCWEEDTFLSGVYRSSDGGRTWEMVQTGLDIDLRPGQSRNLNRIAVCPTNPDLAYLSALEPEDGGQAENFFGIFKSEDRGNAWQWVLRIGQDQPANRVPGWVEKDFGTTWGGAPFYLSVAPSAPLVCYATDWGATYRSVDGGASWQQLYCEVFEDGSVSTRGLDVTNTYWIGFDPFDPQHLALACTDVGAFHSRNGGRSWRHTLQGVPAAWAHNCYRIVFDPQVKGRAWAAWSDCHDMPRPKMFKSGRFDRFQGGITRSEDGLETWQPSGQGLPKNCVPTDLLLDASSPANSRRLYAALVGKGVYRSEDDGKTWHSKNVGIKGNLNAWRLVQLPDSTLYLLVCRGLKNGKEVDGGLYRSQDNAESWQVVALPAGVNFPNDLCFDPSNPRRMILAAWPVLVDGISQHGGAWRTEDGGGSWESIFDPAAHVYGLAWDQQEPATVFLTTFESSIFRSNDRGNCWTRLGGYNFKWAKQPVLDPHHPDMVYLTTFGSSVWYGPANGVAGSLEDVHPV